MAMVSAAAQRRLPDPPAEENPLGMVAGSPSPHMRASVTPTPKAKPPRTKRSHMAAARTALMAKSLAKTDKTGKMLIRKTVGRDTEVAEMRKRIVDFSSDKEDAGIVIFEGEAGIGKTHMCRQAEKIAGQHNMLVLRGDCSPLKDSTPYHPWQNILEEIFDIKFLCEDDARRKVLDRLAADFPELRDRAALLNALLPIHIEDNPKTLMLKGFSRMENTKRLILELFQDLAKSSQMVIIFEDIHWMDSLSWSLLADVSASVHPLFMVLTHRLWIDDAPAPTEYTEIVQSGRGQVYSLSGVTREDSAQLTCRCLRCDEIPEVVMSIVVNRASGNPFFIETASKYLLQSRNVVIKKMKTGIRKCITAENFGGTPMPPNGFAICEARFELLDEQLRLILKVVSVIAGPFTDVMLKGIHPFPSQLVDLENNLEKLETLGFLSTDLYVRPHDAAWDGNKKVPLFSFAHAILQDMIYGMMPSSQRQELHKAAARYYEAARARVANWDKNETGDTNSSPGLDLALAHHWLHTAEPIYAAKPLVASGWDALRRFANAEAVEHFTQAFDLIPQAAVTGNVSRSRLYLMAGEAFYALGSSALAAEHFEECLRLLNKPIQGKVVAAIPESVTVRIMLKKNLVMRKLRRKSRTKVLSQEEQGAATCFERLAHIRQSNSWQSMLLSLKQCAVLEPAGPSGSLLRAVSNICYSACISHQPSTAEKYAQLAISIASDRGWDGDPTALAYANRVVGLYCMGIGSWERAFGMLATAAQFCSKIHDWQGWYESVGYLAMANMLVGHYDTALQQIQTVVASVRAAGHNDSLCWVLCVYMSIILVRGPVIGEHKEMLELLEQCLADEDAPLPLLLVSAGKGLVALAKLRSGEYAVARRLACTHLAAMEDTTQGTVEAEEDVMMEQLGLGQEQAEANRGTTVASSAGGGATTIGTSGEEEEAEGMTNSAAVLNAPQPGDLVVMFGGLPRCAVCEVFIALWDRIPVGSNPAQEYDHARWTMRAVSSLRDLARTFPVLQARVRLYAGQAARLAGRNHGMMSEWRECLEVARALDLPYELGCAHYQLAQWGEHTRATDRLGKETERRAHIASAQRLFASLEGVVFEKAAADSQAIRLHLNPKMHAIERGKNTTVVWPELRPAPAKRLLFCCRPSDDAQP